MKNVLTTLAVTGLSISLFAACSGHKPAGSHHTAVDPQYRVTPNNFEAADANNNGTLSYKEYLALVSVQETEANLAAGKKNATLNADSQTMKAALKSRYNQLDTDKNGTLEADELGAD
ncbi:MAG: hypothetical protein FJX23_06405 [Alphaproteobacteria bacterium]|nr:hypothetical protein [Alphaproteobacteria bacterium]